MGGVSLSKQPTDRDIHTHAGMSTAPETIVAQHCGMKIFTISMVTDMAPLEYTEPDETTEHANNNIGAEVIKSANKYAERMKGLIGELVARI